MSALPLIRSNLTSFKTIKISLRFRKRAEQTLFYLGRRHRKKAVLLVGLNRELPRGELLRLIWVAFQIHLLVWSDRRQLKIVQERVKNRVV